MKKPLNILMATDHSEAAINAGRYAAALAKSTGGMLTFIHVYEIPLSFPVGAADYARATEQLRNSEYKRLERFRYDVFHSLDISPDSLQSECVVQEGNVTRQICKNAKHINADLVVMGTHGMTAFHEVFYGSHTWSVIKDSSIPVLAIPVNAVFEGVKRIVFATEYREGEKQPIAYITRLADSFKADVTLLHIANHAITDKDELSMLRKFTNDIKGNATGDKLNIQLAHYDDVLEGIDDFCKKIKADLLVMSPERPALFEKIFMPKMSMTKQVSIHTHVPLLSVPDFFSAEVSGSQNIFSKQEG